MSKHEDQGRVGAAGTSSVGAKSIARYERSATRTGTVPLAYLLSQQVDDYHGLVARKDWDLAAAATISIGLTALRIAAAPAASETDLRLKLSILRWHVLPAIDRLGRRDVSDILRAVLQEEDVAAEGELAPCDADRPVPHACRVVRARARAEGETKGLAIAGRRERRRAYELNQGRIGRAEQIGPPILRVIAHLKALRAEGRSAAAEGARSALMTLALTLCAITTSEEEEGQGKAATLERILPDLGLVSASLATVAAASVVVEHGRWP